MRGLAHSLATMDAEVAETTQLPHLVHGEESVRAGEMAYDAAEGKLHEDSARCCLRVQSLPGCRSRRSRVNWEARQLSRVSNE